MYGGFNQIGRTGMLTKNSTINQALTAIRPDQSRLTSRFLLNYLNFRVEYWKSVASSSRKDPNITGRDVREFPIALPPLKEQEAAGEALQDIEEQILMLDGLIAKKNNIKQAAMQELLTGKRRLPGFEGEWAQVSLGSVAAMNSGGTPPTGRDDFYCGGIPWVSISDMTSSCRFISETERTLSELGFANCAAKRFPAGTILYAMYASLGECSIAAREVTTSQAILGIRPGPSLVGEYLYYWLESIHGAVKLMGQQGTQSNLNKRIVQGFSLELPSKTEQAAIAKDLSEFDQDIDALKVKVEKTRAMKAGMMQQLLTGKIRLT
jgi:type I restriction enzyme S subunit